MNNWKWEEKPKHANWLQNHYSVIGFETVEGSATNELLSYLLHKENTFSIMGAYGRSDLSRFFKHSHADLLLKTITQSIS